MNPCKLVCFKIIDFVRDREREATENLRRAPVTGFLTREIQSGRNLHYQGTLSPHFLVISEQRTPEQEANL
jgi:hypothetical protein